MPRIAGAGAMASVELPAQQVLSELMARGVNDVVVAVVASPQSTVIGGATETVRELVAAWEQRDVMAREVAVDVASHSPQVDPILDDLYDGAGRAHAQWRRSSRTTPRPCSTRANSRTATPVTGWTICVTRCGSPRRCKPRWRTATGSSPNCHRTRC